MNELKYKDLYRRHYLGMGDKVTFRTKGTSGHAKKGKVVDATDRFYVLEIDGINKTTGNCFVECGSHKETISKQDIYCGDIILDKVQ